MGPSVGDTVAGRYEVLEHAGSGGFSTVLRARDLQTGRAVALKCPDVGTHDREEVIRRFEREVATLGRFAGAIGPSSVVRYVEGNLGDPPEYIALEYLPGDPLSTHLGTGSLGSSVRESIVEDVAETLDFLHRNGVVYLDLKPENLVLRGSGRPVLIDFNTAVSSTASVDTLFEPDQFKPPELLPETGPNREAGPHSDVYSWGKLAFYLLTGAVVRTEDVREGGIDPLDFGGSCSRALADVIRRATRPDPAARPPDGPALRDAVASAVGLGPRAVLSHPETGVECSVSDGHSMGRLAEDGRVPWVVLPDPEQHVSPMHARFDRSGDGWTLTDTSLNGTYLGWDGEWTLLLGEEGHRGQVDRGTADPERRPPSAARVPDGARIAPVHPEYGIELGLSIPAGAD